MTDANEMNTVEDLSIHGWPKIFKAPTWKKKICWTLLCSVAFGGFVFFSKDIVSSYLKRETYITVKVMQRSKLALPALTICNTNFMDIFDPYAEVSIYQELPKSCKDIKEADFINKKNQKQFELGCRMLLANSKSIVANHQGKGFRFPDNFNFLPHSWPCFTLNRAEVLQQSGPSERNGIRMILFYNESERNSAIKIDPLYHIIDERRGIYLDIHDAAVHYHESEGVHLMPGHQTVIKIKKVTSFKKKKPFPIKLLRHKWDSIAFHDREILG